ncbi:MAG: MgtC/SapB family protein [Pseudoxanthomonas sp.]|nr:MgtC/SapB family protein [Pseudoxanthomonas sp.]
MDWNDTLTALATALGIGLLIGAVRERQHAGRISKAGVRTHALLALAGALAFGLGLPVLLVLLAAVALLVLAGYQISREHDPGLTGEIAILVTVLLGALTHSAPALAGATGVVVAILLWAKEPLGRLSRDLISETEMKDGLVLAAAALVVLPLLSDEAIDPWGVVQPAMLWRIVVLIMAVGMLGHVARRAVGARLGLPVAGFFSGFASSTAAVASFGQLGREQPALRPAAASAALLSNLASLLLLVAVIGTVSPALVLASAWPMAAASVALLATAATGLLRRKDGGELPPDPKAHAFHLSHALLIALLIAAVMLVSEGLRHLFGEAGAMAGATIAALAELQAAGATIARLGATGNISPAEARWGLVALLASTTLAKTVLGFSSGGANYGLRVAAGLLAMTGAAALVTALTPP